ncbi:hypothetical protein F3Y22_tig00111837pilonHSYRG00517 [Hibiscus syriacus]|uniref:Glutaredoxin domain-containing protein n=1 Tax=Hibiscus syriacus TaxID=106335 RepID=A0A6A2XYZ8_HIBSY|nr:hypothetical protein F3Y22_tig00111837pilonHSYRG00517 [Hibiscus syriacus]
MGYSHLIHRRNPPVRRPLQSHLSPPNPPLVSPNRSGQSPDSSLLDPRSVTLGSSCPDSMPIASVSLKAAAFQSRGEAVLKPSPLDKFENVCPPNGENRVVLDTTTFRGIRKTFEDCNAVRSATECYGVVIFQRYISMDRGFKEELRELLNGTNQATPPQVFIKGRHVGGAEEVMRMVAQGCFGDLIKGLPKKRAGEVCDGCGDVKLLPCFRCNGSCKMAVVTQESGRNMVVVRCTDCNENGLVLCSICS